MPLSPSTLAELFARITPAELATRLLPISPEESPLGPSLPRGATEQGRQERIALMASLGHETSSLADAAASYAADGVVGNIENYLGVARVPVGLVGPLRIRGVEASGDFYVPMATTEGALVASYNRGAKALSMAGGISVVCIAERVGRAPGFRFRNMSEAAAFVDFVLRQVEEMKRVAGTTTAHGALVDVRVSWDADTVVLLLEFTCGDAAGQNMVTLSSDAVCRYLLDTSPVKPEWWAIDSNLSGDKKATHLSLLSVRGKKVIAEAELPASLVERELRVGVAECVQFWRLFSCFGMQSGSIGVQGHYANALSAVYLACGQDVAAISESAVGWTRIESTRDGNLHISVNLPNVIVGTVGGGTGLPTQRACLDLLGCQGPGSARKLAEICAAVALAGELSGAAALAAGDFASAHRALGRKAREK
jgi:hydroxymethylglutaryl-CoA reductase (NADPH)